MSYELISAKSHPDVLRHFELFKKTLKNMCILGGIWEEYNMELTQQQSWGSENPIDGTYWLKGSSGDNGISSMQIEVLSSGRSLYFRYNRLYELHFFFKKKGQAFGDDENNTKLIEDACSILFYEFKSEYDYAISQDNLALENNKTYNLVVDKMKKISGNNLIGKFNKSVAELRIKSPDKTTSRLQVRGTVHNDLLLFDINLLNITHVQAAKIAKIMAETTQELPSEK
jgi:hypothetical protein